MWFFIGFLMGGRTSSGNFGRRLILMLVWGLPILLADFVVANSSPGLRNPTMLVAWAAMIAFALYKPATSSAKMALIEGAIGWSRLALIIGCVATFVALHDVDFVITRSQGLLYWIPFCAAAIAFERALVWWIDRDVVKRQVVFG